MASLLHPALLGGPPFSATSRVARPLPSPCWGIAEVVLTGASRGLDVKAQRLWAELHGGLLPALKSANHSTGADLQLQVAMVKTHDQARLQELELAREAAEGAADRDGAWLFQAQRWLHQLQDFLVALQHDLHQARQAVDAGLPHADRDWQLLAHAAHAKLDLSLSSSPYPSHQHNSQDSSCSSSMCGSSCTGSSSAGAPSGGSTGAGHTRLVATRSKLGYSHWACKVAL